MPSTHFVKKSIQFFLVGTFSLFLVLRESPMTSLACIPFTRISFSFFVEDPMQVCQSIPSFLGLVVGSMLIFDGRDPIV